MGFNSGFKGLRNFELTNLRIITSRSYYAVYLTHASVIFPYLTKINSEIRTNILFWILIFLMGVRGGIVG